MNQSTNKSHHDADFSETQQIIAAIARGEMVVMM